MLRDYQQKAVNQWLAYRKGLPAVIEAATGAGKSHIIAEIAKLNEGKTLCIAPRVELIEQNFDKYPGQASFFSASKSKCLAHDVIFGTPMSIANSIDQFPKIDLVVIDECHQITPTIKKIVEALGNPRVLGLTATPFRLGEGYIYKYDEHDKPAPEAKNPYFDKLLCRITAKYLIAKGFLTKPVIGAPKIEYTTVGVPESRMDQAFEGKGRKTSKIVADIVQHSHNLKGIIIFAQTVKHAEEIMQSLPSHNSECLTGNTTKDYRKLIIDRFKNQEIKYLVNVQVLTTGFDAAHIDMVAILRSTESPSLLQQIIGRGLRLAPDKDCCYIMDYAQNIERHFPDGDIFNPDIKTLADPKGELIEVDCPECDTTNTFRERPNPNKLPISMDGYFVDTLGQKLPIPAHYGRSCQGRECNYKWFSLECDKCGHDNDISARICKKCKQEIVDPNESLRLKYEGEGKEIKHWKLSKHISRAGNPTIKILFFTSDQKTIPVWFLPQARTDWNKLTLAVYGKKIYNVDTFLAMQRKAAIPKKAVFEKRKGYYKVREFMK